MNHTPVPVILVALLLAACSGPESPPAARSGGRDPSPAAAADPVAAASSVPAPDEPWLLYQGPGSYGPIARLARPDGLDDHAVADDLPGTAQSNPDWSPDGASIVLGLTRGRRDDLWVVGADGSDPHELVDCAGRCDYLDDAAWSPDGASVVFARTADHGRRNTLEVVDVGTGRTSVLVRSGPREFFAGPRWSPDGRTVVCEAVTKERPGLDSDVTGVVLTLVDARGGRLRDLTQPALFAATADWSPTGRLIVYSALPTPRASSPDLFTIRPDGTGRQRITRLVEHGGYAAEPTFGPDDGTVTFAGQREGGGADNLLLRVAVGGGPVRALAEMSGRHPRWRPLPDAG